MSVTCSGAVKCLTVRPEDQFYQEERKQDLAWREKEEEGAEETEKRRVGFMKTERIGRKGNDAKGKEKGRSRKIGYMGKANQMMMNRQKEKK